MPRKYEIVYIFNSELEEEQVNERLTRFHDLLKDDEHPEPVTELDHWGKRTLAFPIKNKEVGYYVVSRLETAPALLAEFERAIKLDESVLRHLVVVNEGELPRPPRSDDDDNGDDSDGDD